MLGAALWLGAFLRGETQTTDVVQGIDRLFPDLANQAIPDLVRSTGANRLMLLLPRPGRAPGWPRATHSPQQPALLLLANDRAVGLLLAAVGGWRTEVAETSEVGPLLSGALSARAAARLLTETVTEAIAIFENLDLSRPSEQEPARVWRQAVESSPRGNQQLLAVLTRAATLLDALDLAASTDGAGVTASQSHARDRAIADARSTIMDVVTCALAGVEPGPVEVPRLSELFNKPG